jgi:hypothetical protein
MNVKKMRRIEKRRAAVHAASTRSGYRPIAELATQFRVSEKTIRQDRRIMGLTHSPVRTAKRRSMMVTRIMFGGWTTRDLMKHHGLARKTIEKDRRVMGLTGARHEAA